MENTAECATPLTAASTADMQTIIITKIEGKVNYFAAGISKILHKPKAAFFQ